MKSFGWIALLLVVCSAAHAEIDTLWYRQVPLTEFNWAFDIATVLHDGKVMAAASRSDGPSVNLWRFSFEGSFEQSDTISFEGTYATIIGMKQLAGGEIALVASYYTGGPDSGYSVAVKRFTEDGVELGSTVQRMQIAEGSVNMAALADGGFVVLGSRYNAAGGAEAILARFNSNGDTLWTRNVGPDAFVNYGRAIRELDNGDLLIAGAIADENFTTSAYVMRMSSEGSAIWNRSYISSTGFGLTATSVDVDGIGNIVVGGTDGNFWWFSRPWAAGLTPEGNPRWTITGTDDLDLGINGIHALPDGGAVFCGSNFPDFGFMQSKIFSIADDGMANLEMEFETPCQLTGMSNDGPRGSVIYGSRGNNQGINEGLLIRFGPGTIIQGFVRAEGTNAPLEGVRVELLESNEFTYTDEQGIYNFGVSRTEGTLRLSSPCTEPHQETVTLIEGEQNVHNFTLGVPRYDNPISSLNLVVTFNMWQYDTLTVYNDGNGTLSFDAEAVELEPVEYNWISVSPAHGEIAPNGSAQIIVGIGPNPQYPYSEFYGEVRVHHNACPDTVNEIGVYSLALDAPDHNPMVETFALHPAYPNPFNAEARVAFDLPQTAQVTAKLYNVQGREVATLADRVYDAGSHELNFSGSNFATGVYLLRLSAGQYSATQKLVLLK
ncbi:MAG: T9SS type A sorting domain-containing protein [bacterium]|nr:T9SS type A sorting domain-containing protein [bacterium]